MPLKTTNNLTEFQQMLFNTISHDLPNLPMEMTDAAREYVFLMAREDTLIQCIQNMINRIEGQPLNTHHASWDEYWPTDKTGNDVMIRAERVTNDETCLIFLEGKDAKGIFTKYLINMKRNTIKHWDGLPWSETHARTQKQEAV